MSMDDLTDDVARRYGGWCGECGPDDAACDLCALAASDEVTGVLEALIAHLREHDLLLGPDGLVRAEPCGWGNRIEGRIAVTTVRRSKPDYGNYERLFSLIPEEGT